MTGIQKEGKKDKKKIKTKTPDLKEKIEIKECI